MSADPQQTVLIVSEEMPDDAPTIKGYDFNQDLGKGQVDLAALLKSYGSTGFQATSLSQAIDEVNRMLHWRLSDEPVKDDDIDEEKDMKYRQSVKCTIFFGFTANMVSCGMREIIRFLVQHSLVHCIVTSGGAVEEDIIKCFRPFYHGDFAQDGVSLRKRGMNRIGNIIVPNNHYCKLEEWLTPILDAMLDEQLATNKVWTPSSMIDRLGKEIQNEESIWHWCHVNQIPVFCPSITDGAIGDNIFFHSFQRPGLVLDLVGDIRKLNAMALHAKHSGMLILGGGTIKHHICNANLMRNGADYSVFINTGQEFDGSDAGARPDEAKSWGKIKIWATPVKVYAEVSLVFPLLVAETFAKVVHQQQQQQQSASDGKSSNGRPLK